MAELFDMEGYESQLTAGLNRLNYRLLDEPLEPTPAPETSHPLQESDSSDDDQVTDLLARPIPMMSRRRSSVTKYSSSYEVGIHESYVSSSLNKAQYRPRLDDFEPIKVLGQGSYGKVLLVREKSTGKLFAQKQLMKASLIINETNEIHKKNYERTLNEKVILEKVDHPNIVKLFYAFQDNNKVYLILEYLEGGEVFHHLAQSNYLSEKDASFYIAQIILALRYLHLNLKVIFRDLKPENCMLKSSGHLALTDFGLSKISSSDSDAKHSMIGTAMYMAPEVIKGEDYDFNVDWWSLGCVLFDMLTGSPPFTGHNTERVMDKIVQSKKFLKFPFYLSPDAKDLLKKLLQPNPKRRLDIDNDFDKVKEHKFFRHIDWSQLDPVNIEEVLPPILPIVTDPVLAENFDDEFTSMPFTPPGACLAPSTEDVLHVQGFTFTNETFLSQLQKSYN